MRKIKYSICFLSLAILLFSECTNDEEAKGFPSVTTLSNMVIQEDGVLVFAEIQQEGFFDIVDHGFVYSLEGEDSNYDQVSLGSFSGINSFNVMIDRNLQQGKSYVVKAYVKTKNRTVYGNPITFLSKGGKSPLIKSFYPEVAFIGDTVTISGDYFSNKNNDNTISFGTVQAKPVQSNDTILKVIVPLLEKSVNVQLKIQVAGKTAVSVRNFTLGLPVVYGYTPEKALPTETVKIKGKGLSLVKMITIDGILHYITQGSDTTVQFILSNELNKGKKSLQLSQLDRITLVGKQLNVVFPEILSVSPLTAWIDTILVVKGTHLDKLDRLTVDYDLMETVFTSDSLVKLRVLSLFNSGYVHGRFQYSEVVSSQLVNFNPPVITSITPSIATYGETIHITGDRFLPDMRCSDWYFSYLSKNEATLIVPWTIPAGPNPINLSHDNVIYPSGVKRLTIPEIEIVKVSPYEIKRGSEITLEVKNLPESIWFKHYSFLKLDGKNCPLTEITNGTVKAIVDEYVVCSENPKLDFYVGAQHKTVAGAFHFTEKWQQVNIPINLTSDMSLFTISDGLPYVLSLGQIGVSNSILKKFDAVLEQWSYVTSLPNPAFKYPLTSFSLGTDLFFAGFDDNSSGTIYKYSLSDKSWTRITDFPEQIWMGDNPFAFVIGGKAYMGTSKGFYQYDNIGNRWIKKAKMPTTIEGIRNPLGFSIMNKGFVGFRKYDFYENQACEFWEYNPQSDSWKDLGILPFSVYGGGTGIEYNGKVYLSGKSFNSIDTFMEFDPITYKFKEMLSPPRMSYDESISFILGNYLYITSAGNIDYLWMYKIPLNDFQSIYKM